MEKQPRNREKQEGRSSITFKIFILNYDLLYGITSEYIT